MHDLTIFYTILLCESSHEPNTTFTLLNQIVIIVISLSKKIAFLGMSNNMPRFKFQPLFLILIQRPRLICAME